MLQFGTKDCRRAWHVILAQEVSRKRDESYLEFWSKCCAYILQLFRYVLIFESLDTEISGYASGKRSAWTLEATSDNKRRKVKG